MTFSSHFDKIKEQEWFIQIKSSYDQLSSDQQQYVKWGGFAFFLLLLIYLTFTTVDLANNAKDEYFDKQELSSVVSKANDEIRRLKGQNSGIKQNGAIQSWKVIFQGLASMQGLPDGSIEITKESPGATQNIIQETLIELKVKGLSTRQLTQFLYAAEHGNPPMKLKGMKVEPGGEGTLVASLNLSAFLSKPEKGDKSK